MRSTSKQTMQVCAAAGLLHPVAQRQGAGDNKSRGMLAFCMMLVKWGVCSVVVLSMLIVGHTHIDIDQFFSIPAKHMNSIAIAGQTPLLRTPQEAMDCWRAAFKHISPPDFEVLHQVFDYMGHFGMG